ncbi:hypothetical protein NIES4074_16830 [Cylindrospermum sp. NIES-4074]|nr:hypothetical protein NIES4074_16830 [Cylindrospermum sp. NIES-4074]
MGFIKKLIAGILGFLAGLLPGKKKGNGYYLELEEPATETAPAASNGVKAAAPAPVASAPAPTPAPKAEKATKAKPSKNGKAAKVEPAAAPAAKPAAPKTPTETTFAPKYLSPSAATSNGRRRPGANMSAYLDLARQVKTPG